MKKAKRFHTLRHSIIAGILVVVLIAANIAMYIFFDLITRWTNGMGVDVENEEVQEIQVEATDFTQEVTAEGIVLLRNERDALPIPENSNVNLFGWSSTQMVSGGSGGSGGSSGADIDFKTSLENAGFTVNEDLYNMYTEFKDHRSNTDDKEYGSYSPSWDTSEPEITDTEYYTEDLLASAKEFSDIAIMVMSRTSGEGLDVPADYLAMTTEEKDLVKYLTENYETVIVVVNSAPAIELGYLEEVDVEGILLMPGPGGSGANSLGKILKGEVNPSGHLVDTYSYDHTSSPSYYYANRQGTMEYSNWEGYYYVDYVEGIYVGYRYYETAAEEGFIDYDTTVQYPFGYGLSYTTFEKEVTNVEGDLSSDEIQITVNVTNTGDTAGKEVVQIYATAPYYQGEIEKSAVDLIGFAKTKELEPGESESVTISVQPYEIASYDYNDANGDGKTGYVLDPGEYEIKLMDNSHDLVSVAATYTLDSAIYFDTDPVTDAEITNLFTEADGSQESEPVEYISRADFAGTWPAEKDSNIGRAATEEVMTYVEEMPYEDDPDAKEITTGAHNGLTFEDVIGLDYDDPTWDKLLDEITFDEMESLLTGTAYGIPEIASIDLPAMVFSEGPQGVNAWMAGVRGTSYPVEMYLGLAWNTDLAYQEGVMFGREASASGVTAMMAPAVNIHRTPYAGRNFEYFAEDGLLAGKMAANEIVGAEEEGVILFEKHFALNDQETYRGEYFTSLFTWSNEQAIREVFVKPFEIGVKEGNATAIMSSFNRIGDTWSGANHALLTDLLRTEWGFEGAVITDMYDTANNEWWMNIEQAIRAGQDFYLSAFSVGELSLDYTNPTDQQNMRRATKNVLYMLSRAESQSATLEANWFYHLALPIDIACWVLVAAYIIFIIVRTRRQKKQDKLEADVEHTV